MPLSAEGMSPTNAPFCAHTKKAVLQPQQSTLYVGSTISMGLNFFHPEFTGEEVSVHPPLSMSVFLASPVFQVFILLMVLLVGLSCVLDIVFRELRRKNVINHLTAKCINNALPFCSWASSVNAYGKLCLRNFLVLYWYVSTMSRHSFSSYKVLRLTVCCSDCWCAAFVVLFYFSAWRSLLKRHHLTASDILLYTPCSTEKMIDLF